MSDDVTENNALMVPGHGVLSPDQLPDLEAMEPGFSLQAQYIEFKAEGESFRGVLIGWTTMKSQQKDENGNVKDVDVAILQNKLGVFVNAGANLVSQLRNCPVGTAVQIIYSGEVKAKSGFNVKTFEVRLLNAPGSKPFVGAVPRTTPAAASGNGGTETKVVESKATFDPVHLGQTTINTIRESVPKQSGAIADISKSMTSVRTKLLTACNGSETIVSAVTGAIFPDSGGDLNKLTGQQLQAEFAAFRVVKVGDTWKPASDANEKINAILAYTGSLAKSPPVPDVSPEEQEWPF